MWEIPKGDRRSKSSVLGEKRLVSVRTEAYTYFYVNCKGFTLFRFNVSDSLEFSVC